MLLCRERSGADVPLKVPADEAVASSLLKRKGKRKKEEGENGREAAASWNAYTHVPWHRMFASRVPQHSRTAEHSIARHFN